MKKDFVKKYGKWALVTGGSSGIGLAFSHLLAEKKMNILMIARNEGKLKNAAVEVRNKYGIEVKTLSVDLLKSTAVDEIADYTKGMDIGLAVLNAGMELSGHFTKRNRKQHEDLMHINVEVPTQMAHTFSERFIAKRKGGIIFVSSLFGYQGVPMFTTYSASKAYILAFGEGLSVELKPFGVDVTVLSPGPTKTDMLDNMDIDFGKMPVSILSARKTANAAVKGLGRKMSVVPGVLNKVYVNENRLLPRSTPIKLFGFLTKMALNKNKRSEYLIGK